MRRKFLFTLIALMAMLSMVLSAGPVLAGDNGQPLHPKGKIKPAERQAAAAARLAAVKAKGLTPLAAVPVPGGVPDYFGFTPNYANSPTNMRKFVDALPALTMAVADQASYPGSDYYEIELGQYTAQMHADLPATTLRGYRQTNTTGPASAFSYLGPVILANRDVPVRVKFTNNLPTGASGNLFLPVDTTYMGAGLGPAGEVTSIAITNAGAGYVTAPAVTISAPGKGGTRATAIATVNNGAVNNIKLTNPGAGYTALPTVTVGAAPKGGTNATATATFTATAGNYTQNRATLHLHGGATPWISDGTPHQWTTPAAENATYPEGVSVFNVPDMPDPGPGSITFFYTNQQSARLMFYHDHAYGITRLNVYAGEAAGYLVTDAVEQALINGGTITPPAGGPAPVTVAAGTLPDLGTPLVIQDKTFVDAAKIGLQDPTWAGPLTSGALWFPHVYMPNQNPYDISGANPMGRWDYGPWFWPPFTGLQFGPVANPYYDPINAPWEPPFMPGTPNPSGVPEGFMDTPVVNGKAYPTMNVPAGPVRLRILNAANDRYWNLQLYQATPGIVSSITVAAGGTGYKAPVVTITGDGVGATALANLDPVTGAITSIDMLSVGSRYTTATAVITETPPVGSGASLTANVYVAPTEVGMVPASLSAGIAFPAGWTVQTPPYTPDVLDGRQGGVPDPALRGPAMIQIGTEGGFLPGPALLPNTPMGYEQNKRNITVLNVKEHTLFLGPAERADVLVDFTNFSGKTLIMYNDAPAALPAGDPRNDYYTGDLDMTSSGGAPPTLPGYGPNTRTVMQIVVAGGGSTTAPPDDYNPATLATLQSVLPAAFSASQDTIIVPQSAYAQVYPGQPVSTGVAQYVKIQDTSYAFDPVGPTGQITMNLQPKTIQELFTVDYGRMNATLGVELPFTNGTIQTTIPYGYVDPVTELVAITDRATPIGAINDGTQLWKITHNGVDTHAIHVHLFNAQVVNRIGWDGQIYPPEPNELGWKETIRMNPLQDIVLAVRPLTLTLPFSVPNSSRPIDVTRPLGATGTQFFNVDPNGAPVTVVNHVVNFGWEYVWHCHLLGHEENDMMRPMAMALPPKAPTGLTATPSKGKVALSWTNNAGADAASFTVQRATDTAFTAGLATFPNITKTTYTDSTTVAGTSYYYRVFAVGNPVGDSGTAGYATLAASSGSATAGPVLAQ